MLKMRLFESTGIKLRLLLLANLLLSINYLTFYGMSLTNLLVVLVMYFLYMCIGMVCTFHRFYSHKSFEFRNQFMKYLCTSLGLLSGSGSVFGWCGVHNKHHDKHDTPDDPHDTKRGFLRLVTLNYNYNVELRYVKYLFKDKFLMMSHKYYYLMILAYVTLIAIFFGIEGVVFAFCIPSALNVFIQGVTTFFFHKDGAPRYVNWLNWLVFGDGNHDEHHKDVKRYKLKRYDISGWVIYNLLKKT
jgi:sn-1 stearoyl-lipid 9-desaturase